MYVFLKEELVKALCLIHNSKQNGTKIHYLTINLFQKKQRLFIHKLIIYFFYAINFQYVQLYILLVSSSLVDI